MMPQMIKNKATKYCRISGRAKIKIPNTMAKIEASCFASNFICITSIRVSFQVTLKVETVMSRACRGTTSSFCAYVPSLPRDHKQLLCLCSELAEGLYSRRPSIFYHDYKNR